MRNQYLIYPKKLATLTVSLVLLSWSSALLSSNQPPPWALEECREANRNLQDRRNCAMRTVREKQQSSCSLYDGNERSTCENSVFMTGNFEPPVVAGAEPERRREEDAREIEEGRRSAAATGGNSGACNGLSVSIQFSGNASSRGSNTIRVPSNPSRMTFDQCSDLLGEEWSTARVTEGGRRRPSQDVWRGTFVKLAEAKNQQMRNQGGPRVAELLTEASQDASKLAQALLSCEGLRSMTGIDASASGGEGQSRSRGGNNQAAAGGTKKSADGTIECKSCGEQTQDFNACKKAVNAYDVALVGQVGFSGFQQLSYLDATMDAQMNMDPNSPTAGLEAQQKGIQTQGNLATQQAGVDAAKAAAFLAMWQQIPDPDRVIEKCVQDATRGRAVDLTGSGGIGTIHTEFQAAINTAASGASSCLQVVRQGGSANGTGSVVTLSELQTRGNTNDNEIRRRCNEELRNNPCILNNQEAKDKMKQAAILAGIESFVNMGKAALLNKQAKRIGKLIDEVEEFAPQTLTYQEDDFFGSECLANPQAPGCDTSLNQQRFDFGPNEPLQIHGLSQASTFGRESSGDQSALGPDVRGSGTDRDDIATPVGTIDPGRKDGGGFSDRLPGAGQVTSGGPTGGGAGGGGGGLGGGAPPAAAGGRGGDAPRMASPTAPTVGRDYAGGAGTVRLGGGGRGINSRGPAGEAENPFANMFGDKGPTDDSLNFRDLANNDDIANESGPSIFSIITNRYSAVRESDRLINYEKVGE